VDALQERPQLLSPAASGLRSRVSAGAAGAQGESDLLPSASNKNQCPVGRCIKTSTVKDGLPKPTCVRSLGTSPQVNSVGSKPAA
jgi:hypothetical protein